MLGKGFLIHPAAFSDTFVSPRRPLCAHACVLSQQINNLRGQKDNNTTNVISALAYTNSYETAAKFMT